MFQAFSVEASDVLEEKCLGEEHLSGILNVLLDPDKEGDSFPAVEESVVIGKGDNHDGADDNLAVNDDGLVLDCVHTWETKGKQLNTQDTKGQHTKDSRLRKVDNGSAI